MALDEPGGKVMNPFEPPETKDELFVPPIRRLVWVFNVVRLMVKFTVTVVVLVLVSLLFYLAFVVRWKR